MNKPWPKASLGEVLRRTAKLVAGTPEREQRIEENRGNIRNLVAKHGQ